MITPSIRGGHEVCSPVAVEGAEPGDGIAIRIKDIAVTSRATSSGNDQAMEGRFNGDPYCAPVCAECGKALSRSNRCCDHRKNPRDRYTDLSSYSIAPATD